MPTLAIPLTNTDDLEDAEDGQQAILMAERDAAREAVSAGKVFKYCPTEPHRPKRVFWITNEAQIARVWRRLRVK
ncbi:MAG: hypothetical protein IPQ07_38005 [Myxococcales bacterium]|nr:hypothetical protein [Myxococcales bacterium]